MILVLPQWVYGFYNLLSGSSFYDSYLYQLYNIAFTALPIVIYAILDYEFEDDELLN